jgi:hypothetical protein
MNTRLGRLVALVLLVPAISFGGVMDPIEQLLRKSKESYAKIDDYACLLHRKDMVNGKLKEHESVIFKYKRHGRFYMKWPKEKIEAIYADGRYDNKMVIHGGILFKFMSIAVKPEAALKYNRHTMPEADIGHILDIMEANYRRSLGDADAKVEIEKEETLEGRKTWRVTAEFPPDKGYYGHIVHLNIDKELLLPVRIEVYGWKQELLEEYFYENLELNTGLTEEDFDVKNKKYSFKIGY